MNAGGFSRRVSLKSSGAMIVGLLAGFTATPMLSCSAGP